MKKRKYKSVITKRIFKSIKKLSVILFLLVFGLSLGKIGGTNSFFTDTAISSGNIMTAGYWVPPTISISSPSAGNEWQVGSAHDISWSAASSDPSATAGMAIGIDYACDAAAWTNIIAGTANDGTFSWTVPANISNNCKIKVTATDSHALTNSADSAIFKIKSPIVLNEFIPDPVENDDALMPGGEWVELYNNSATNVDVSGWYLYDSNDTHALQITTGNSDNNNNTSDSGETIVPAHGWLVVYRNHDSDFELNNTGSDSVRLFNGAISSGANLIDAHNYTVANVSGDSDPVISAGAANSLGGNLNETNSGKSWARFPDGTGSWFDPVPTPGEKNTKSMDLDKFRKYYSDRCVKDGSAVSIKKDPVCDVDFLTWLGVLDAKENVIPETEILAVENSAIIPTDPTLNPNPDPALNPDAPIIPAGGTIIPADNAGNDAIIPTDNGENTQDINVDENADNIPAVIDEPVVNEPVVEPKIDIAPEIKKEDPAIEVKEPEEPKPAETETQL